VEPVSGGSKVLKCHAFRWEGIEVRGYKADAEHFRGVTRQTLLGEGEGEEDLGSVSRYFEVAPGGFSSLELHRHPHAVVVLRGRGTVRLGEETFDLEPFDCVYVSPETPHQFRAAPDEPLGFLCVVERDRDRPRMVDEGGPLES
jgi:quercetin dioxygenase-like cupin family protein